MTSNDSRWIWFLVWRVAVYALLGALSCAVVGAVLIGASGALVGGLGALARWTVDLNMRPIRHSLTGEGAVLGGTAGGASGALIGLIILGIFGLIWPPRHSFWPPKTLFTALFVGMSLATVGAMASYFVLCALLAPSQGSFSLAISEGRYWILIAAPFAMVCGQIAGALIALRRHKTPPV